MRSRDKIFILIVLFLVPTIIHLLYSFHICSFLESRWESGALLNYTGTIVAVAVAYYGVIKTIETNNESRIDEKLNSVLPYISIEKIDCRLSKAISNNFNTVNCNKTDKEYIESNLSYKYYKKYCFVVKENTIECKKELSDEENKIIINNGLVCSQIVKGVISEQVNAMIIDLLVTNVGNGSAIKMGIGLIREGMDEKFTEAFSFEVKKPLIVRFFSCADFEKIYGKYYLEFNYYNIYGDEYIQKFEIDISKNEKKICCHSVDDRILKHSSHKITF